MPVSSKPSAVFVDIDGTLALMGDRNPFSAYGVGKDSPNAPVMEVPYEALYMRGLSDARQDAVIKKEICQREIETRFEVLCVLDDRNQTVRMWRKLGLTCLQVAPGNF